MHLHRPKLGLRIPWGYVQDPTDKTMLQPIERDLDLLDKAKEHYRNGQASLRDIAAWLSKETGHYISHQGFKDRLREDKKRKIDRRPQPAAGNETKDTA